MIIYILYNVISIQIRAVLSTQNNPPRPQSSPGDNEKTKENYIRFHLSHSEVNYSIFLQYSDSLMNARYHEVASAMSVSLEMQCCFGRVIRPESLCIYHADGFLTEAKLRRSIGS